MTTGFPAPGLSSIDSGLVSDIPSVTTAHTYNGTSTTQVLELSQLVSTLQEENQSLQSQLSSLQEQYEGAMMNAQVTAHYKTELALLQETLLKTEEELQSREKEMDELKSTHSIELKQLLHQQEKVREALLTEQNDKHLAHIKRLTQELSVQHSPPQDDTEKEAERIKQLKNKLSELHEKEKEDILLAHQKEKTLLQNEHESQKQDLITSYQQSMESNRQQLEALANEQIKQLHNQYITSLTTINEQKHVIETDLVKMREQNQNFSEQIAVLEREKQNAEKQILQLQENHSRQLQAVKDDSHDLEKRLQDWKTKAASLESRLQQSSAIQTENLQSLQETEERIHTQYKQKMSTQQDEIQSLKEKLEQAELSREEYTGHYEKLVHEKSALIEDLQNELKTTTELHNTTIKEMKDKYLTELQNLEAEHSNQVSVLENSISEKSSSQASLEFAEAHMSKLQQELNAYRNQESDHKTALELLHKEHQEAVENLVSQREERIKTLTKDHEISVSQLQNEITSLQAKVVQVEEEKRILEQTLNQNLQDLEVKLKVDHEKNMDVVKENHAHTLQKMKTDLETHYQQLLYEEIDKIKTQVSIEKEAELQQARANNVRTLQELKESLTATGDQALTDAQTRIINLEQKLDEAESDIRMTRQLQEQCQKYETELKASQVHRSLAESGLQEEQRCHLQTQKQLEEIEKKVFDLESTLSETKEKQEQEKSEFEAVCQRKEDELASLSSRNQTLQSRVAELTQELEQERLTSQLRQENAETVKLSELSTVHSKLEDAKQKYSSLLQEWSEKEKGLQEKLQTTEEKLSYRENEWSQQSLEQSTQLVQLEQQLNEQSIQLTSIKEELQQRNAEIEEMKQQNGDMRNQLQVLTDAHSKLKEENVNINDQLRQSLNLVEQLQEELKEKDQCREDYLKVCQERDKNDTELQNAQVYLQVLFVKLNDIFFVSLLEYIVRSVTNNY